MGGDGCVSTESSEVVEEWPETWRIIGERRRIKFQYRWYIIRLCTIGLSKLLLVVHIGSLIKVIHLRYRHKINNYF